MLARSLIFSRKAEKVLTKISVVPYSKGNNKSRNFGPFKIISRNSAEELDGSSYLGIVPNWELLAPRGYRLCLPGSVGPAWHDVSFTAQLMNTNFLSIETGKIPEVPATSKDTHFCITVFEWEIQKCPFLMRKGILELFTGIDLSHSGLTIVTLSQKTEYDMRGTDCEVEKERERLAKCFVLAAQEICTRLKIMGYWADFINPFSGYPHLSPHQPPANWNADEIFQCLRLKVKEQSSCVIMANEDKDKTDKYSGSLYTTAPPSETMLRDLLLPSD